MMKSENSRNLKKKKEAGEVPSCSKGKKERLVDSLSQEASLRVAAVLVCKSLP